MIVILDGKSLESALVEMAGSRRMVMRVPAHRVRVRDATQKRGQLAVLHRPQHEMPMIGHHAIGQNFHGELLVRFADHPLERLVVRVLLKQRQAGDGAIQRVVDQSLRSMTSDPRHGGNLT